MDLASLGDALADKVRAAEEAIYADPADPLVNWAEDDRRAAFAAAGLSDVAVESQESLSETCITPAIWVVGSAQQPATTAQAMASASPRS